MGWHVGSFELQNQELIKARRSALKETRNCIFSFLYRVLILLPIGRKGTVSLVGCVSRREINTHNPNANRMATFSREFLSLSHQITDYAINLLDHRLGQYFGFGSYLNIRDWSARNRESLICDRLRYGNSFAECSITSPPWNTDSKILRVQHTAPGINALVKSGGLVQDIKVFVEVAGYPISQAGVSVEIRMPFKETTEYSQHRIIRINHLRRLYIELCLKQERLLF